MPEVTPGSPAAAFTGLDWLVIVACLVAMTAIGAWFSGRPATIREFFLGGRKLPWYAVSGSIVATEISALTFVGLPYVVFRDGGNFTYLQLGLIGALFARLIVGYVLVPAYYLREIYSPYDYIGQRLGEPARRAASILFVISGILAQSARLFLTAMVLDLILGPSWLGWLNELTGLSTMTLSVWTIGTVAVLWTLMGGIATVIWTDVFLFLLFLSGAIVSLIFIVGSLDGGWSELIAVSHTAGKFRLLDFDTSPFATYTIWTAVIASTWHNVGAYGTDQLIAQRIFCCRGPKEARKAIISSYAGLFVTVLIMLVGAGLYAYYQAHPLEGEALRLYQEDGNRIFPLFIIGVLPAGLTGLLIAAVFAAAISSLDSLLAALSQTTLSTIYLPRLRTPSAEPPPIEDVRDSRRLLRFSRLLVVAWGIILCLLAQLAGAAAAQYPTLLDLGLGMAGYAGGALLAGFLLAYLPLGVDARGFIWSAPISVAMVFAAVWHQPWAWRVCLAFVLAVVLLWFAFVWPVDKLRRIRRTLWLLLALAILLVVNRWAYVEVSAAGVITYRSIAWPWYSVIGSTTAFVFGWLLAGRRADATHLERPGGTGLLTAPIDRLTATPAHPPAGG